jgi:hypothetical protein
MILRANTSLRSILRPLSTPGATLPTLRRKEGLEARNAPFKGFIGTGKVVTFHDKLEATRLQVFEGFMDYLSYLSKDKPSQPVGAVLELNSTNLWRRALPYISDPRFAEMRLYLDNDDAGSAASS